MYHSFNHHFFFYGDPFYGGGGGEFHDLVALTMGVSIGFMTDINQQMTLCEADGLILFSFSFFFSLAFSSMKYQFEIVSIICKLSTSR